MWRFVKKIFSGLAIFKRLSRPVKELLISSAILNFAASAVSLYEPIYLYTIGFSIKEIIFFFLAVYCLYFVIMPFGAKVTRRMGYEFGIIASTPCLILYYLSLFAIPRGEIFIIPAIIFLALDKMFYWPGYNADFARFTEEADLGKSISIMTVFTYSAWILGPFCGGIVLKFFSFKVLFAIAAVLILVSNIPLLTTKEVFEPREFNYFDAYKRLFRKENRRKLLAYLGFGEEFIAVLIWPIFIYTILGDYFSIGSIIALATFATMLVVLYIGRITDTGSRHSVLRTGVVFSVITWILRMATGGRLGVFIADSSYGIAKNIIGVPLTAITYKHAKEYSVTKTAIFFEMSLTIGKILAAVALLIIISVWGMSWNAAFALAGAMTLFYLFLR